MLTTTRFIENAKLALACACTLATALLASGCNLNSDSQQASLLVNSAVEVTPAEVPADGVSAADIVVTVRGLGGAPRSGSVVFVASSLTGSTVEQAIVTTDGNGRAQTSVSSSTAGTAVITARFDGPSGALLAASGQVRFTSLATPTALPLAIAISPSSAVADDVATLSVNVAGPMGQAVSLSTVEASDTLDPKAGTFDSTGHFAAKWRTRRSGKRAVVAVSEGLSVTGEGTFVAGPIDTSTLFLVVAEPNVVADGAAAAVGVVSAADVFGNAVSGQRVDFSLDPPLSTAAVSPPQAVSDASGLASARVVSRSTGTTQLSAKVAGTLLQTQVNFIAGATSAAASTFSATSVGAVADGTQGIVFALQARDALGHVTPGRTVSFAAAAPAAVAPPSAQTDSWGQASVTVRSTKAGSAGVQATLDGVTLSANANFGAGAFSSGTSSFAVAPNQLVAGTQAAATAIALDTFGNAVAGVPVAFNGTGGGVQCSPSSTVTDSMGQAVAAVASTQVGSSTVSATVNGYLYSVPLSVVAASPNAATSSFTVGGSSLPADGVTALPLTLTVADAYGNAISGVAVQFISSEGSDTLVVGNANTDAQGTAVATLTATRSGPRTLRARADALELNALTTFVSGPAMAAQSTLTLSPNQVVADGTSAATLHVLARDAYQNGVPGLSVLPMVTGSGADFSPAAGTTDANGSIAFQLRGRRAGLQTASVRLGDGNVVLSTPVAFSAGSPNASQSTLAASPNALAADGVSATTLTVTLRDAYANPVAGQSVVVSVPGPATLSGPLSGTTNAAGSFSVGFRSVQAGGRTVNATGGGLSLTTSVTLLPTAPSSANSALSISPTSVTANAVAAATLTVRVRDVHDNAIADTPVGLTASGSANVFGQASGSTDGSGVFSTTLRSSTAEAKQISASFVGGASQTAAVIFVAGAANAGLSSLAVVPPVNEAGLASALQATFVDAYGNPVAGKAVSFGSSDSNDALAPASATTNASGLATASLTSTRAATRAITATADNVAISANATFVAASPNSMVTQIIANPATQVADGTSGISLTARVFDQFQNPVAGRTIVLASDNVAGSDAFMPSSGVSNASGSFFSTFTSTLAGARSVRFSLDGNVLSTGVTFVAGSPNSAMSTLAASPNATFADNAAAISLTATARDAFGNPVANANVAFTASGTSNQFAMATGVTDANGQCTTLLRSAIAQHKLITADFGSAAAAQADVEFVPGGVDVASSTLTVSPNSLIADGVSTGSVVVSARDAQANPVAGVSVALSASGSASFGSASGISDATGTFSTTISGTVADLETIGVSLSGLMGPTATVQFFPGAADATKSLFTASPSSAQADGVATISATVVAVDAYNNRIPAVSVSLSNPGGHAVFAAPSGATDGNGQWLSSLTNTSAEVATLKATFAGVTLSTPATFVAGPASAANSTLVASPNNFVANGVASCALTATLRDAYNNIVPYAAVALYGASAGDMLANGNGNCDAAGVFTATLRSTTAAVKQFYVVAADGNVPVTVTTVAGSPNAATSTLNAAPSSQVADNVSTLVLTGTLRDRFGNVVTGKTASFASSNTLGNDLFSALTATTDAAGQATTTLRSNRAEAKTITWSSSPASVPVAVTFVAGAPVLATSSFAVSAQNTTANGNAATTLSVTVRDAFGNAVPNQTVIFGSNGPADALSATNGNTTSLGTLTATLKATVAGTRQVTATFNGLTLTGNAVFVPGPPAMAQSTFVASPNLVVADNAQTASLVLMARDAFGNATPGIAASISSTGSGDTVSPMSGTTDANGTFAAAFRTSVAQPKSLTASAASVTLGTSLTAMAGAANATTSSLSLAPVGRAADAVSATTATLVVRDAFANLVSGQSVSWSSTETTDLFSVPTGATNANGVLATALTATRAGLRTISASFAGLTLSGNVAFVPGSPNAAISTLTVSPNAFVADNTATVSATVVVRDAFANVVPASPVAFSSTGSGDSFAVAGGNTNAAGALTTTLRSTVAQSRAVVATLSPGNGNLTATVLSTAGSPNAAMSSLVLSPNALTADGVAATTVVATVRDKFANAVPNQAVSFSSNSNTDVFAAASGSTNAAGAYTTTLTATRAETKTVVASVGAIALSANATFVAGTPNASLSSFSASPNSFVADQSATSALMVTLVDAYANPVPMWRVSLSSSGNNDLFAATNGNTTLGGTFTTTLRSSVAEAKTLTAALAGGLGTLTTSVTTLAGAPNTALSTLAAAPATQVADGNATMVLTATLRDRFGNLVPGRAGTFTSSNTLSNDTFTLVNATTDSAGQAIASVRSSKAEAKTYTFTAGPAAPQVAVSFFAGAPSATTSTLTASPNNLVANGNAAATVSVTVRDPFGNPVPFAAIALSSSGAGDALGASNGNTNAAGIFTTTLTATRAEAKVVTLQSGDAILRAAVSFVAGPPSAATSILAASPNAIVADAATSSTLTVLVRDAFANPIANAAVAFGSDGNGDTFALTNGTTDASGSLSTSLVTTTARTKLISASAGAASVATVVVGQAGSPNAATSALMSSPNSVIADGNNAATLTMLVRDRFNNAVPMQAVSFSSSNGNDVFGQAAGTTNAAGAYTTSLRSIRAESKSITATAAGVTLQGNVTFVAGSPNAALSVLTVSPNSIVADNVATATALAVVSDAFGNFVPGAQVAFSGQAGDMFAPTNAATDALGTASSVVRTTAAAGKVATCSLGAGNGSITAPWGAIAGAPNTTMSSLVAVPLAQVADNQYLISLTGTLRDRYGNVVPAVPATFSSTNTGGNDVFMPPNGATDANGQLSATLRSNKAENKTVTLAGGGATPQVALSFVPGAPYGPASSLVLSPNGVVADGVASTTASATIRDSFGNPVDNVSVTLASSGTANAFSAANGNAAGGGLFSAALRSTKAEVKTVTAYAAAANVSTQVAFIAGAPAAAYSSLVLSPNTIVADNAAASSLLVHAADAYNNAAPGVSVTLSSDGSGDTFFAGASVTDANGNLAASLRTTKAQSKVISAQLGAAVVSATLIAGAGSPNASQSTLVASPNSFVADAVANSNIVLLVYDAYLNSVPSAPVSLSSTGTSNTFGASSGTTDAFGAFRTTLRTTVAQPKSVTADLGTGTVSVNVVSVAGSPNAAMSTLSISPNNAVADGVSTTTATLTVRDRYANVVGAQSVGFSSSNANDVLTSPSTTTNASGLCSTQIRTTIAQTKVVTATAGSATLNANIAFVAGTPNATLSTLSASPASFVADNAATTSVTLTVLDAYSNRVSAAPVSFFTAGSGDAFSVTTGSTSAAGTLSTQLRTTVAASKSVSASLGVGNGNVSTTVTAVAGTPNTAMSSVTISPNVQVADNVAVVAASGLVRDRYANPVPNQATSFASSNAGGNDVFSQLNGTTDASGLVSSTLRSTRAEAKVVTLSAGPAAPQANVTFTAGAPASLTSALAISPNNVVADGNATTALSFTVRDAYGNLVPNQAVSYTVSGTTNVVGASSGVTNSAGLATATLATRTAQLKTVNAVAGDANVSAQIAFVAGGAAAAQSSIMATPNTIIADNSNSTTLSVQAADQFGNAVANANVALGSSGAGDAFGATTGKTTAAGAFVTTLRTSKAEVKTLTATIGSASVSTTLTSIAGAPNATTSYLAVTPNSFVADNVAMGNVLLTVLDAYGNPVPSAAVTLSGSAGDVFVSSSGSTNGAGQFATRLRSTVAQSRNVTANLGATNGNVTATVVTLAGSPNSTMSALSLSPSGQVANGLATSTATFTVRDAYANTVSSQPVNFSSANGNDILSSPNATTNAAGVATTTVATTKAEPKTITAVAGAASLQANTTFVAGSPNAAISTLSISPNNVVADGVGTTTAALVVRDRYANVVGGQNVTFSSSNTNDVLTSPSATTNASGLASTQIQTTTAQTKAITATAGPATLNANITFVAGTPNAALSTLSASPASFVADNTATTSVTLTVVDAYSNRVSAAPVSFFTAGSGDTFSIITGSTSASGTLATTLRTTVAAGKTVSASLGAGNGNVSTTVIAVAGTPNTAMSAVTISPNVQVADNVATVTASGLVRDRYANPVPNQATSFASSNAGGNDVFSQLTGTTDASGQISSTLRSTRAEAKVVTLSAGPAAPQANVTFTAGAPASLTSALTISPNNVVADGNATTALSFTVRDAYGNLVPNQAVSYVVSGTTNVVGASSGVTNAAGLATATLATSTAQTKTVTATAANANVSAQITFVAGNVVAAQSSIVATPNTIIADNSNSTSLSVQAADQFGNAVANANVALTSSGSGDAFGALTGKTNASGLFSTSLRTTKAESKTITATIGTVSVATTLTSLPAAPNATLSSLAVTPNSFVADNVAMGNVLLTVLDAYGNLVPAASVSFSGGAGDTFVSSAGATNGAGQFATRLRSNVAQSRSVVANLGGANGSVSTIVVTLAGSPNSAMSALTISPSGQVANGVATSTATFTVRDAYANSVPNQPVTFASANGNDIVGNASTTSNGAGVATTTLATTKAEVKTITATSGPASIQANTTFVAGSPNALRSQLAAAPTSFIADNSATTTITATVLDAFNNRVAGSPISLATGISGDVFAAGTGNTLIDGTFSTTLRATAAGNKSVIASLAAGTGNVILSVTATAGSANTLTSTLTANPSSQTADNAATVALAGTIRDRYNNPVGNQAVTFTTSNANGNDTFSLVSASTDANGVATATVKSNKAESKTFTLNAGSASLQANATFVAAAAATGTTTLAMSPNTVVANGVAGTTATLIVRDAFGNLVNGQMVSLTSSGSNNVFSAASGATDGNGVFTTTLKSTKAQVKTVTASAGAATATAAVGFVAGTPNALLSTLTASPNTFVADNIAASTIMVTVADAFANPVASANVTFGSTGGGDTIGSTAVSADGNGQASTTLRSTIAQSRTVTATFDGAAGNLNVTVLTLAGAPNSALSSIAISPSTQIADTQASTTVLVALRDRYNNKANGVSIALSSSNTGGNDFFAPTSVTSGADGNATVLLRSSKAESKTIGFSAGGASGSTNVVFVAGAPNATMSTILASPATQTTDGNITLISTILDAYANPIAGATVAWSATGQNNTFSTASVTSAATGATPAVTLRSTTAQVETVQASIGLGASAYGSKTAPIQFLGGMASAAKSQISFVNPNGGVVWGNTNVTINVRLIDQYNNTSPNQRILVRSSMPYDTFSVFPGYTDANGMLSASMGAALMGPRTVTVSAPGFSQSAVVQFASTASFCTGTPRIGGAPALQTTGQFYGQAVGDFDRDGFSDIAVISSSANQLSVYRSKGNGLFNPVATYSLGCSPNSILARDLGNDNYLDLAIGCSDANVVKIATNTGNGNFTLSNSVATGFPTMGLAAGIINADTALDLAVFQPSTGKLAILLNAGSNSFSLASTATVTGTPLDVAIADMDNDGIGDLLLAASSANLVVRVPINSSGTLGTPATLLSGPTPCSIRAGLLNDDTNLDFAVKFCGGDQSDWLGFGAGDGTVASSRRLGPGGYTGSLRLFDYDNDGKLDIVSLGAPSVGALTLSVYRNTGAGSFSTTQTTNLNYFVSPAPPFSLGDINGDGRVDVIASSSTATPLVAVQYGVPGGGFEVVNSLVGPGGVNGGLIVADFDLDGNVDIAFPTSLSRVAVSFGTGDGNFSRRSISPSLTSPLDGSIPVVRSLTGADLNGDGWLDAVFVSNNGTTPGLGSFINDSKGNMAPGAFLPMNGVISGYANNLGQAVADFDQDGVADLMLSNSAGNVLVATGLGNGNFVISRFMNVPGTSQISDIKSADINGDGVADVCGSMYPGSSTGFFCFLGRGNGDFNAIAIINNVDQAGDLWLADFNGDGRTDLISQSVVNRNTILHLGRGDGTFQSAVYSPLFLAGTRSVIGDFDGDGRLDIAMPDDAQPKGAGFVVAYGDGINSFVRTTIYPTQLRVQRAIGTADIDRDGRMDIVMPDFSSTFIELRLNKSCLF